MSPDPSRAFLPFAPQPDRDSQPYWEALGRGEFQLQQCDACGVYRWPARALCNRCRSFEARWTDVERTGRVASWVRTHQAFAPALKESVPYVVIQVELDVQSDLLLIGGWLDARTPRFREAVRLEFIRGPEGFTLPCWKAVSSESDPA